MRVDCDQDAVLLQVRVAGDGGCCHTGRRSCFYRVVPDQAKAPSPRLGVEAVYFAMTSTSWSRPDFASNSRV